MKLLIYSWFPVLDKLMIGGAQQAMHDLLVGFSKAGLEVTVICPNTKTDGDKLLTIDNIKLLPILKEINNRSLFPYEHFYNMKCIAHAARSADLVWVLDHVFPLKIPQPIILTLDNFTYKEEMESLLDLNWDMLIVPSKYLFELAKSIVGPEFWNGIARPLCVVPYAVDSTIFKPTPTSDLCDRLGLSPNGQYLLFPHRPDPDKGFDLALRVTQELQNRKKNYTLLIPINETYKSDIRYYQSLHNQATSMGIDSHVIFHNWIDLYDMPAYFSLGSWTLALGTFPEGFGFTPVQSVQCGTPVISTRAGALANHFPPSHGVHYVDFGSIDQVVNRILDGVTDDELGRGRAYATSKYSIEQCVSGYIKCFETVKKSHALYDPLGSHISIQLSPWCHLINESTLWHDYRGREYKLSKSEVDLIKEVKMGNLDSIRNYSVQVNKLLSQGILIGSLPEKVL